MTNDDTEPADQQALCVELTLLMIFRGKWSGRQYCPIISSLHIKLVLHTNITTIFNLSVKIAMPV